MTLFLWFDKIQNSMRNKCSIKGCNKIVKGHGMCQNHLAQAKRSGKIEGKKCSVDGCNANAFCKGMCNRHYLHNKKYGSPISGGSYTQDGRFSHPLYKIWLGMKGRCYNKNAPQYANYGGRGVKVCDRWLEPNGAGFWNFVADMGERPRGRSKSGKLSEYSIDRIDTTGDYSPENCRWANWIQQSINKRTTQHPYIYLRKNGKYRVCLRRDGENLFSKECDSEIEAIKSRDEALRRLGFPEV